MPEKRKAGAGRRHGGAHGASAVGGVADEAGAPGQATSRAAKRKEAQPGAIFFGMHVCFCWPVSGARIPKRDPWP